MPRRRQPQDEPAPDLAEALPEAPTEPAADPQPEELPYEVRRWNDLPQYVCRQCGFDVLDLSAMLRHLAEQHGPPEPPRQPRTIVVTDRFGNVVEEREV